MGILICAATATEARACELGVRDAGCDFEVLRTGVGPARAALALSRRLEGGPRPELVVSSGFAGALSHTIPLRSWVVAKQIHRAGADETTQVSVSRLRVAHENTLSCNFVTAGELTLQSVDSAKRYERIPAPVAVDMESAAMAAVAEKYGLAFMVLRLVTDTPEKPLPEFVSAFAGAMAAGDMKSRVKLSLHGLVGVAKNPGGALHLVTEGRNWAQLLRSGWCEHATKL